MSAQPSGDPRGDLAAVQRAAIGGKIGVAEAAGLEERPALHSSVRVEHLDRPAAGLHALAVFLRFVAWLARHADEASGIKMVLPETAPKFGPRVVGLGDQSSVAGRGAVSAADDAVMIARRR